MALDSTKCFICWRHFEDGESIKELKPNEWTCNCAACGPYKCEHDCASKELAALSETDRARLSGVIREENERARSVDGVWLESNCIESLLSGAPSKFDVPTKARKFLAAIVRKSDAPGSEVKIIGNSDFSLAYASGLAELNFVKHYAERMEWITVKQGSKITVTPNGWEEVQRRPRIESMKGFVAMWFGGDDNTELMTDAYQKGFRPAIEEDAHYKAIRIDGKEFNGDIVDEIMAEIRESRFVVADLTGHRGGVYFEGGFAKGLGIDVIWTCHAGDAGNTHFDTNHQKQIRWTTPDDLRQQLSVRIRATIGLGPLQRDEVLR